MPVPVNPFKQALGAGETVFGCWLGLADTFAAELMGTTGFDWLLIDGEHAPNDLRSILAQLQVLEASPSHAIVRVPVGETYLIKQVLDAGAQTILVPMVEQTIHLMMRSSMTSVSTLYQVQAYLVTGYIQPN